MPKRAYITPTTTIFHTTSVQQQVNQTNAARDSTHEDHSSSNHGKEIKDTKLIFNQAWKNIEDHYGRENLHLPREFIFLMGAPGSGKGTHTPSILRARGITNPPISVSNLLDTPECKELINRGQMISDRTVMEMLFHALLDCDPTVGVLVDGFPRTEIQVEALRLFYDKMIELRRQFWNTDRRDQFPRPVFRICVLYVDEDISVQRQLARGQMIREHNAQVRRSGQGVLWEERVTDFDETLIRSRYAIFKAHYGALLKLSKIFPFRKYRYDLINAVGNINEVMQIILKEFEYQSSLELESDTYDAISHIPLANKIGVHARQELISRLEHYQMQEPQLLQKAIKWIDGAVVPQVTRHAISGAAMIRTEDPELSNGHFVDMVMDVLSERGYHVSFESRTTHIPCKVDISSGDITLEHREVYVLNVHFPKHYIQPLEQKFD
ncbi:hypothetical protein Unana1_07622 [Umbelopsis nana]